MKSDVTWNVAWNKIDRCCVSVSLKLPQKRKTCIKTKIRVALQIEYSFWNTLTFSFSDADLLES